MNVELQLTFAFVCYLLAALLILNRSSLAAVLAPVCLATSIMLFNFWRLAPDTAFCPDCPAAFAFDNVGQSSVAVMYGAAATAIVWSGGVKDFTSKALWVVLLFLELWALVIERIACNLAEHVSGLAQVGGSVCERAGAVPSWIPLSVGVVAFACLTLMAIEWTQLTKRLFWLWPPSRRG